MKSVSAQGEFWEQRYRDKTESELGWHEIKSEPSLSLISECHLGKDASILDVGSGASLLIDDLLANGYTNIRALDISPVALAVTKKRVQDTKNRVQFIVDDITSPQHLTKGDRVDLWHDRATLHFLTKPKDRQLYVEVLNKTISSDGYVILATFSINGVKQCSGLDIAPYTPHQLGMLLGKNFKLLRSVEFDYRTPWGEIRPFTYGLFKNQRKQESRI